MSEIKFDSGEAHIPCNVAINERCASRNQTTLFDKILGNDQLDTQLFYFTIRLLWSFTCLEHYMLNIRRVNCIDASTMLPAGSPDAEELRIQTTGRQLRGCIIP